MCGLEYQRISLIKTRHLQYISAFQFVNPQVATFAHLSRRQLPKFLRGRLHLHKCGLPALGDYSNCHVYLETGKNITFGSQVAKSCTKVAVAIRNTKKLKSNSSPATFIQVVLHVLRPYDGTWFTYGFPHLNMLNYQPLELHRPLGRCTGVYSYS